MRLTQEACAWRLGPHSTGDGNGWKNGLTKVVVEKGPSIEVMPDIDKSTLAQVHLLPNFVSDGRSIFESVSKSQGM